ncbi:hypothetical protein SAFG77S_09994 [Streptomyces afghaniensis]
MDVDRRGHLTHARLAVLGEDLQHGDGTVNGLHSATGSACGLSAVVAHGETLGAMGNGCEGVGLIFLKQISQRKTTVRLPLTMTRL